MPSTVRIAPYYISEQLEFIPSDPYDPTNEELDLSWLVTETDAEGDHRGMTLELRKSDAPWRALRVELAAQLEESALKRVLPPTSNLAEDTMLVVSVRCPSTKLRRAVLLKCVGQGKWSGQITVHRREVRSTVRLEPRLVRRTALPGADEPLGNVARDRGALIAEGPAVILAIDETARRVPGAIKMGWEDFRVSSHLWRKAHSTNLFFLEIDDEPLLWLNSVYSQLRAVLYSKADSGTDAVLRRMSNALLAQSVWLKLFTVALNALSLDEETDEVDPPEGWRAIVLTNFLRRIYPGVGKDEQLRRVMAARGPDQIGTLMSQAGSVVQEIVGSHSLVAKAIRAAESIRDETGEGL
jgi:hypothetical protein